MRPERPNWSFFKAFDPVATTASDSLNSVGLRGGLSVVGRRAFEHLAALSERNDEQTMYEHHQPILSDDCNRPQCLWIVPPKKGTPKEKKAHTNHEQSFGMEQETACTEPQHTVRSFSLRVVAVVAGELPLQSATIARLTPTTDSSDLDHLQIWKPWIVPAKRRATLDATLHQAKALTSQHISKHTSTTEQSIVSVLLILPWTRTESILPHGRGLLKRTPGLPRVPRTPF